MKDEKGKSSPSHRHESLPGGLITQAGCREPGGMTGLRRHSAFLLLHPELGAPPALPGPSPHPPAGRDTGEVPKCGNQGQRQLWSADILGMRDARTLGARKSVAGDTPEQLSPSPSGASRWLPSPARPILAPESMVPPSATSPEGTALLSLPRDASLASPRANRSSPGSPAHSPPWGHHPPSHW